MIPRPVFLSARGACSVILALAAGLLLRLWMLRSFFQVDGDSLIYGGIAKNLLLHGRYALTIEATGETYSTLIRLPGYPFFLAFCFRLFGMGNYAAAAYLGMVLDLAGCVLLADFVRRVASPRWSSGAAHCALWLAALCPFTADYAAQPLSEAPTLFSIALALWTARRFEESPAWRYALPFTFAVTFAALLRPDGALVGVALAPVLAITLFRPRGRSFEPLDETPERRPGQFASLPLLSPGRRLRMAAVCVLLALAPFAAWTWRNWHVFHVLEPLAPRLATDPGEDPHAGWERWVKTWCLDFSSTYDIYWNVPEALLDAGKLPDRAFDSPEQRAETLALVADYNTYQALTPEIDARFARLASQRVTAHPLRSHFLLPLGRLADMWFRPRVENMPIDLDWWVYSHHHAETRICVAYAALNLIYVVLGLAGLFLRPRLWPWLLGYVALRSALLLTVEAPETRYTIECFPMLFALGGMAMAAGYSRLLGRVGQKLR